MPYSNRLPNQQARSRAWARGPFQLKRPHLINWLCVSMATTLIPWVNQLAWKSIPWWFAYKENLQMHVLMAPLITICAKVRQPRIAASPQRGYKTDQRKSQIQRVWTCVFGFTSFSEMWQMFKEDMFLSKSPWVMKTQSQLPMQCVGVCMQQLCLSVLPQTERCPIKACLRRHCHFLLHVPQACLDLPQIYTL